MRIDAHQHFWELQRGDYDWLTPELTAIYRDFMPSDILPLLKQTDLAGTIVIQATDCEAETHYLLSIAERHDWILGVVGWVDMVADTAVDSITRFSTHPKFVGIRPMVQEIEDDNWLLRPALVPAIKSLIENKLTFDALILPRHLPTMYHFLLRYPDLSVVIDHGAKPQIRDAQFQPWAKQIAEIARSTKASCKLSGLVTEAGANWTTSDIVPYVEHILSCFGCDRVMFGSDWPVLNLATDYNTWYTLAQTLCSKYAKEEINAVFGRTAHRFYLSH